MKFSISSAALLKGLLDVSKAIPSKTTLQILENFLVVVKGSTLEVTASDSELTLRTSIEADKVEEEGALAIPARHIIDLLKELPDQPILIRTLTDSSFECCWASGNSVLPFFPAYGYIYNAKLDGRWGKLLGGNFERVISDPTWLKNYWDMGIVGGPLLDLHVHDAHFIRALFGQPQAVQGTGRCRGDIHPGHAAWRPLDRR